MSEPRSLDELFADLIKQQQLQNGKLPPVEKWSPALSGDLDMRIDREGRWYYLGGEIHRKPLVKLFSSILKKEGDDHFLVTPVEKWRIQVENAPFVAIDVHFLHEGKSNLAQFTLNEGSLVILRDGDGFWVEHDAHGEPRPLLSVRAGLQALVHRNVFYRLVELAEERQGELRFSSYGHWFSLGSTGEG